jgi:hypothetical protein
MSAKTTATRAKRGDSAMDQLVKRINARSHRDSLGAEYHVLMDQLKLLEWMDRTPADRRREVNRLYRECNRKAVAWQKARDKCERLSAE